MPPLQGCQLPQSSPARVKGETVCRRSLPYGTRAVSPRAGPDSSGYSAPLAEQHGTLRNTLFGPSGRDHRLFCLSGIRRSQASMVEPLPIKHHSLTGRISLDLLAQAFGSVARNKGAAGLDGVSVELFRANALDNLRSLRNDLKQGTFQPMPARRVLIPKGEGRFRPLGIPTVRDRVAQEVLRRLLEPLFEPLFHPDSYGFRPGRSC